MWSPIKQEAVEKIRKAQWSVENTRATQAIVNKLVTVREALKVLTGCNGPIPLVLDEVVARFIALDPKVKEKHEP